METPRRTTRTSTQAPTLSGLSKGTWSLSYPVKHRKTWAYHKGHVQLQETDTRENESTDINETTTEYPSTWCIRGRTILQSNEYPVRRTFSGAGNDVWNEFIQYKSTLKGHTAMKQRFVTEAKLRKRNPEESCRDFGQAIEGLYCRAYPDSPEIEDENFIKTLLDKCGQSGDFRLAVKRTRYNTLHDAVINAMQEECFRVGEKDFNIPDICWKTNTIAGRQYSLKVNQPYLDLSYDLGIEQIVDFPTRQDNFLDLLFTSHPAFKLRCKQLPPLGDKSDHDIVLYDRTHQVSRKKNTT
ncbi:unnamed protein product [Mytilus edulis]|uniref:Uncharacterized protein n=1 Tax=Mytilus edulis TaxID=6550 RepID=A0A8S3PQ88_MYTED|nr:unnamed protein product [Mytilus edulis]